MNILSEIIAKKRERLIVASELVPLAEIQRLAGEVRTSAAAHALSNALWPDGMHVIAEFKRRSPSKGVIRPDADRSCQPLAIAYLFFYFSCQLARLLVVV